MLSSLSAPGMTYEGWTQSASSPTGSCGRQEHHLDVKRSPAQLKHWRVNPQLQQGYAHLSAPGAQVAHEHLTRKALRLPDRFAHCEEVGGPVALPSTLLNMLKLDLNGG